MPKRRLGHYCLINHVIHHHPCNAVPLPAIQMHANRMKPMVFLGRHDTAGSTTDDLVEIRRRPQQLFNQGILFVSMVALNLEAHCANDALAAVAALGVTCGLRYLPDAVDEHPLLECQANGQPTNCV